MENQKIAHATTKQSIPIELIVAMDQNNGIGLNGDLPWRLSNDMAYFKEKTSITKDPNKKNAVLMGRKTYESIPEKFRPLPNRLNIILTRNPNPNFPSSPNCHTTKSLESAITYINETNQNTDTQSIETMFIIGGGQIYEEAITKNICSKLWITQLNTTFNCTTHFPQIPNQYTLNTSSEKKTENKIEFKFLEYINSQLK